MVGTFVMLSERAPIGWGWTSRPRPPSASIISRRRVYGSLGDEGLFTEETPYDPRSPYSASKAGSDHLVSAWGHTMACPS